MGGLNGGTALCFLHPKTHSRAVLSYTEQHKIWQSDVQLRPILNSYLDNWLMISAERAHQGL